MEGEQYDLNKGNEIMFSLSVETHSEYRQWMEQIKKAGGKIQFDSNIDRNEFYDKNGYYVCVLADQDEHKSNLLYNKNKQ